MVVFKWPLKNGTGTWVLQGILTIPGKECSGNGDKPTSIGQMVLYRSRTSSRHTGVQFESIVKTALYWGNWGYLQLSLPDHLVQVVKVFRRTVPDKKIYHRTHTILNLSLVYFCSFFSYFTITRIVQQRLPNILWFSEINFSSIFSLLKYSFSQNIQVSILTCIFWLNEDLTRLNIGSYCSHWINLEKKIKK